MEIIGKVKIKWNDAPVSVPVTADGYIQMPDGTMRRLREETFQGIKEKLLATTPAQQTESESEDLLSPLRPLSPLAPLSLRHRRLCLHRYLKRLSRRRKILLRS